MLKKSRMENNKPVATHMVTSCKLSKDDESLDVDQKKYRSMIDGLVHLIAFRPNIMQAICLVARFQANLKQSHDQEVKRIFTYEVYSRLWFVV